MNLLATVTCLVFFFEIRLNFKLRLECKLVTCRDEIGGYGVGDTHGHNVFFHKHYSRVSSCDKRVHTFMFKLDLNL